METSGSRAFSDMPRRWTRPSIGTSVNLMAAEWAPDSPGPIERALMQQRVVLISGTVDHQSAGTIAGWLMTLDAIGDEPIELRMNAASDSLDVAFALMDTIDVLGVRINATVAGAVTGTMVGVLAICGHRRIGPLGSVWLREPHDEYNGSATDIARRPPKTSSGGWPSSLAVWRRRQGAHSNTWRPTSSREGISTRRPRSTASLTRSSPAEARMAIQADAGGDDPIQRVTEWLAAARGAGEPLPEAMTLATSTTDGRPSARMVMLRGLDQGLVFFTDSQSDKGLDLASNPLAAIVLHWLAPSHRQVRACGPVERVSEKENDDYWTARRPEARRAALAWEQSQAVDGRPELEERLAAVARSIPGGLRRPSPKPVVWIPTASSRSGVLGGVVGRTPRPGAVPPPRRGLGGGAALTVIESAEVRRGAGSRCGGDAVGAGMRPEVHRSGPETQSVLVLLYGVREPARGACHRVRWPHLHRGPGRGTGRRPPSPDRCSGNPGPGRKRD